MQDNKDLVFSYVLETELFDLKISLFGFLMPQMTALGC